MAYHPPGPEIQLEETRDEEPSSLVHNDMHGDNFIFGMLEGATFISKGNSVYLHDHAFVPPLKVIDFGCAEENPEARPNFFDLTTLLTDHDVRLELHKHRPATGRRNVGIDYNLRDIGVLIGRLLNVQASGLQINVHEWSRNPAVRPDLDPDLRLLIARCIAIDPLNRPRLEELDTLIKNGVFSKGAARYGAAGQGNGLESDATLQRIVNTYILSADT
ncbi:hypothetical protein F4781DRAFT_432069 [Annulohypoxylon bovei var. microspora]|nr:hypothetical protein F4781DRAFT_432069 [Annulohypoxylon bovei var. microspora]